ncbi:MAG: hypothetical protein ACM3ZE_08625, partial [Myxococcales bacterium]
VAALTTATYGLAATTLRTTGDQRGDFVLFGNTLGWDCNLTATGLVVAGTVDCSGASNFTANNTSADVYWRSEEPGPGAALASAAVTMENARSTAVLVLPAGAVVTYARLYWAALLPSGTPDDSVTIDRPGNTNALSVTADKVWTAYTTGSTGKFWYQGTADITNWMSALGAGAYRVGGVSSIPNLSSYDDTNTMAGWSVVVFYSLASDPPRNLTLFDGLDTVNAGDAGRQTAEIGGFLVPATGYDAKLGVVAYEGDSDYTGDSLSIGATAASLTPLSNGLNPADNFFNSTHSYLGVGVSNAGDLPQLSGAASSMAGLDIDILNVTAQMQPNQTKATIQAASATGGERFGLAVLVTSISTFKPDFSTSGKTVVDLNGGALVPGDVLEYTVTIPNTGSDASTNTVLTDNLPTQVTYKANSLSLVSSPTVTTPLTDATGDDVGEYIAANRRILVRLGTGATAAAGGTMAIGSSVSLKFQVTLNNDATGLIENQATITAQGAQGAPAVDYLTDGNGSVDGTQPTVIGVDSDADGIPNATEATLGTNPNDKDSDDDGVEDGAEPNYSADSDGDGLINALDPDSDNDGLFDGTELGLGCGNAGTDLNAARCIPDADAGATKTDPLLADTDGGGARDGSEDANLNGQVDSGETNPIAGQGADDATLVDTDGDGLSNGLEATLGSNPNDKDSDDDGVLDGLEPNPSDDGDRDGLVDVTDSDSDNDGLFDGTEMSYGCTDAATSAAAKQCVADADPATHTSAVNPDTDRGGVRDGSEDVNRNGAVNGAETNPIAGQAADDTNAVNQDTDGDGLSNAVEATLCSTINNATVCSDANDKDSDDDGAPDGEEANPASDTDGDGIINVLDADSDADGLFDGTELGYGCAGAGTATGSLTCIADGDAGATQTSPIDADTDRGGIKDGTEDANHNGVVDANERNPLVRADDAWGCLLDADCDASTSSGKVCAPTHVCVAGCRGSGGNGCPTGQVCSSTTTEVGTCGTSAGVGGAAGAAGAPIAAGAAGTSMVAGGATAVLAGGATAVGGATTAVSGGVAGALAAGGAAVAGATSTTNTTTPSGGAATGGKANAGAATGGALAAGGATTSENTEAIGGSVGGTDLLLEGSGCDCALPTKRANHQGWLLAMVAGVLWLRRRRSR